VHYNAALTHFSVCAIICCFRMTLSSASLLASSVVSGSKLSRMTSDRNLMYLESLVRIWINGLSKQEFFLLTLTSESASPFCVVYPFIQPPKSHALQCFSLARTVNILVTVHLLVCGSELASKLWFCGPT